MKKTKGFIAEFREFIMRGSVIDMAIGVVIATAFGKITTSLVNEIIMPFIGWIIGDFDLAKWNIIIEAPIYDEAGVVTDPGIVIAIGNFIATIINFIIIAFIIFLVVKLINKAREKAEARKKKEAEEAVAEDPKPTTEELLTEILAEMKKK